MRSSKADLPAAGKPAAGRPAEDRDLNRFRTDVPEEGDLHAAPGNPLYRVLALYLPWSVLGGLLPAALALIHRLLPELILPVSTALALEVYLPALFGSAAVTLYLELLDPRTSHSAAHIRGTVLAAAGAYLLGSLLSLRLPFSLPGLGRRFLPALGNVTAVLATLYIWIFVIYARDLFRAREIFEFHLRRYRGEDLRRVMLEDSEVMMGAEARIRSMTRHYGLQLGIVFFLALLCGLLGAPLSPVQYVLIMLVLAAAAMIFSLLNLFRQEQFFAGEGIAVPAPERHKRLGAGILFCGGAGILAALCASPRNILPISLITGLFAALARFLGRLYRPAGGPVEMPRQNLSPGFDPQALARLVGAEESEPWPFWDYLPYIALTLVIAVFLWFMVKPLFGLRAGPGKIPLGLRLLRLARGGLAAVKAAFRGFLSSLRSGGARRVPLAEAELRNVTEDLLAAWSTARKRELRRSLGLFARLILWGNQRYGLSWKPSLGPGEFCALLAEKAARGEEAPSGELSGAEPALAARILRCGDIFEAALYGPRLPDEERRREFRLLVEDITGQPGPSPPEPPPTDEGQSHRPPKR
jgi:hypothetical protein